MAIPTTQPYRRNLAALFAFQPQVASLVDAAMIPEGVTTATGRDGSRTFVLPGKDGRRVWFGGSSMPTISVPELFANFRDTSAGVLLPGVLTGWELRFLTDRMPAFGALFVVEEDPLAIKLAMQLHDYTDLITAGRLVFLTTGEVVQGLRTFFEAHPGYEFPKRLLTVPHRSAAAMAELQRQLESAGEVVLAAQARVVEAGARALERRAFRSLPDRPRVAVVSVDAVPASIEQAGRIARALAGLEWPHETCVPDAPHHCHLAARLQAIGRVSADWVLLLNCGAGHLRAVLPRGLPVASWFTEANVGRAASEGLALDHLVFAASTAIADSLTRAGVPGDMIERCEVGADDTVYRPLDLSTTEQNVADVDVALLMDLPDDRPEASNLTLASHLALWRGMQATVAENVDRYQDALADELLDTAQRTSGVALQDVGIRKQFLELLRTRIAPARLGCAAAGTLVAAGYRVEVWGTNWSGQVNHAGTWRGTIPGGEVLNRMFNEAKVIVFPCLSINAIQTALDALAAGARITCRRPERPFNREHSGLASLSPYLHFYRTSRELLGTVKRLRSADEALLTQPDAARTAVISEHTVARRLRAMVQCLRERRANASGIN